jgi:hypothetical protein
MNPVTVPRKENTLAWLGVEAVVLGTQHMGHGLAAWIALRPTALHVRAATPSRALQISETRIVGELEVTNCYADSIVVPANLVMRGGLQTRAVERSVVLAPSSTARIPVKCVEKGRWSPETPATGASLSNTETTSVSVRREMSAMKRMSLHGGTGYAAPQGAVWEGVEKELTRTGVRSPTSSYGTYLGTARKRMVESVERHGYSVPDAANAVLLVSQGTWFAFEAFSSADALVETAPTLLADLFEPAPRTSDLQLPVGEIVARVWSAKLEPLAAVAGTIGQPFAASAMGLDGEVMLVDGRVAHATMAGEW